MTTEELRTRVIFSLLSPAARMAIQSMFSLKNMKQLIELALYREARRQRLKMKEIGHHLAISMSKVGLLSKQLKAHFAQPESEHGLPRKILALLWAGPMSRQKITQALEEHEDAEVDAALTALLKDKRITEDPGPTITRYKLGAPQHRLVQEPWMAKIDALDDLMGVVVRTVEGRFFRGDPRAFARTLQFRVRPEDIPRLQAHYEALFALVCELDEAAVECEAEPSSAIPLKLSLLWSPEDPTPPEDPGGE